MTSHPPNLSAKPLSGTVIKVGLFNQPDDPGPGICPTCGCRCRKSDDVVAMKLLKGNAGRVDKTIIARALGWSLHKLERFAAKTNVNLETHRPEKEPEPRGA